MTEKDFDNLSWLLRAARDLVNSDVPSPAPEYLAQVVSSLAHLRLRGDPDEHHDYVLTDDNGDIPDQDFLLPYHADALIMYYWDHQALLAEYTNLKKLYDTRMKVTQDAMTSAKAELVTRAEQVSDGKKFVGAVSAHLKTLTEELNQFLNSQFCNHIGRPEQ